MILVQQPQNCAQLLVHVRLKLRTDQTEPADDDLGFDGHELVSANHVRDSQTGAWKLGVTRLTEDVGGGQRVAYDARDRRKNYVVSNLSLGYNQGRPHLRASQVCEREPGENDVATAQKSASHKVWPSLSE